MTDYKLEINQIKNTFILTDYELNKTTIRYSYSKRDRILKLSSNINGIEIIIKTKAINWQQIPALQKQFHWTVD